MLLLDQSSASKGNVPNSEIILGGMIICKKIDRYFKKRKIIFSFKIIKSGGIKETQIKTCKFTGKLAFTSSPGLKL